MNLVALAHDWPLRRRVPFLLVWLLIGSASHYSAAEPNKVIYELQERCGKRAVEFFKDLGLSGASYENHYNPDLNGCFMLVTITRHETGKGITMMDWQLWDVNENREIDFLGYRPDLKKAAIVGTPENSCLVGDFDHCPHTENFARSVHQYMQR